MESEKLGATSHLRLLEAAAGLVVLAFFLNAMTKTEADPDLWGYLAFGRLFWQTGVFPYRDVFSYVPTLPLWVYHEWLTGVVFYPLYLKFGGTGLQLLRYALALATLGLLYLTARERGADGLSAALVLFVIQVFAVIGFSPVRAQTFTYLGYAATLYALEKARITQQRRVLWLLVPLQLLWSNLHGGFLAGLGLMALYALGEALSRRPFLPYLRVLLLAGLATLINPYGLKYWLYLFHAVSMPRPEITEWASILTAYQKNYLGTFEVTYLLFLMALTGFLAIRARWREPAPMLALGLALYLGLRHQRHLVFPLMLMGAYLPVLLKSYLESHSQLLAALSRLDWRIPATLLCFLALVSGYQFSQHGPLRLEIPPLPQRNIRPGKYYPMGALEFIRAHHLQGNLLTEFGWGEYLIWSLYPQCRVALDGRYETVYPGEVANKYFDFVNQSGRARQFLEDYPPDLILLAPNTEACPVLRADPRWRQVYADPGSILFIPKDRK